MAYHSHGVSSFENTGILLLVKRPSYMIRELSRQITYIGVLGSNPTNTGLIEVLHDASYKVNSSSYSARLAYG